MKKKIKHVSIKPISWHLERQIKRVKADYLKNGPKPGWTRQQFRQLMKIGMKTLADLKKEGL